MHYTQFRFFTQKARQKEYAQCVFTVGTVAAIQRFFSEKAWQKGHEGGTLSVVSLPRDTHPATPKLHLDGCYRLRNRGQGVIVKKEAIVC